MVTMAIGSTSSMSASMSAARSGGTGAMQANAKQMEAILEFANRVQVPAGADRDKIDNLPEKVVGAVFVNGKVAAVVYRSGAVMSADSFSSRIHGLMEQNAGGGNLAQTRLGLIAQELGGTVVLVPPKG